jgi:4-amino-4-deoxy-L-arabinose transferase-like glycosyltransferase
MERRLPSVLLIVACLLPFIRLGLGEIQPWDESLYVIRAEACLKFGAWLDQTQYAVGHLYSATHPPLGVWLIAISKYLFGDSTFAIRLPVAMAASASIYILFLIVRKFTSKEAALVAAVSLSVADLFLLFSHRAQMECFILFSALAAIFFLSVVIERDQWLAALLSGIALGLGLLTKFAEAFFIVPFILLMPWALSKPRAIRYVGISIAIAVIIMIPWFAMIALLHPDYWNHVYGSLQTLRQGNYHPSSLAWWYYLNRLIVGLPLVVSALFVRGSSRLFRTSFVWLLSILIVLQLVDTRMPHFAFLLLAPGAMLIGASWDKLNEMTSKRRGAIFTLTLFTVAWSASEQVRLLVTHRMLWNNTIFAPSGWIIVSIAFILSGIALHFAHDRMRFATAFVVILVGIAFAHLFSEGNFVFENGASQVATIISHPSSKTNIVVIHYDFPNEEYAPQLAYYTCGWTLGWIPGKTSRTFTWDTAAINSYKPDSSQDFVIVTRSVDRFNHLSDKDSAVMDTLMSKLWSNFAHKREFQSYVVFF